MPREVPRRFWCSKPRMMVPMIVKQEEGREGGCLCGNGGGNGEGREDGKRWLDEWKQCMNGMY